MKSFFAKAVFAKQSDKKDTFLYILTLCYLIPFGFLLAANMLFSLFQTTYMELYLDTEKPLYKADSPFLLLLCSLLFLGVCCFFFKKRTLSVSFCRHMEQGALIYAALLCLLIISVYKVEVACDSEYLSDIAISFLNGDYSSFEGNGYLAHYPHQVGMIALIELVYFLFGTENFLVLQLINTITIVLIIYFLHRIASALFDDLRIQCLVSLLCIGFLPLYLFSTFIYGDIPGLGLVVPVIYLVIRYLNTGKKWLVLPASLCMAFAIIIKSNNTVILVAAVIILLMHAFSKKDWFGLIFAAALLFVPSFGSTCVQSYYANAAGLEALPPGIPKAAWIAMGLQKNDYLENGWYNSYNWNIYTENGFDTDKTTAACMDSIKASLNSFLSAPKSGIHFFYKKFISQWNNPTHNSLIITEWYSRHSKGQHPLAHYLIYDNGRFLLEGIMNLHQFITLLGAAVFAVRSLQKWSLSSAFLSLCVFGGYFFHLIWEAGGRYALGYFVLCIPMAGYGLSECCTLLAFFFKKLSNRQKNIGQAH